MMIKKMMFFLAIALGVLIFALFIGAIFLSDSVGAVVVVENMSSEKVRNISVKIQSHEKRITNLNSGEVREVSFAHFNDGLIEAKSVFEDGSSIDYLGTYVTPGSKQIVFLFVYADRIEGFSRKGMR